eukprot:TRINITY_DN1633_c0_g2_i7.p1 TRINITY_DN1633_c0_g2~~TRINITY_DN1633_c0_g2_i7.p1  ORF type:complete len:264 (-),score=65.78 TRINITY_DN1633_c0_g2_i7:102-893(-)
MRTKHAILFRLSNKTIEVVFEDKTEIILNSQKREAVYVNKEGSWETFSLTAALTSNNAETTKRLKYAKEVLASVVSSGSRTGKLVDNGVERKNRDSLKDKSALNSSSSARRLASELKALQQSAGQGFSVSLPSESNIYIWNISFEGPRDSLYKGGVYRAELIFSVNYPHEPPLLRFLTDMWHPNIHPDGKACLAILKSAGNGGQGRWRARLSVEAVAVSVVAMLSEPSLNSPANMEAAKEYKENYEGFKRKVRKLAAKSVEEV